MHIKLIAWLKDVGAKYPSKNPQFNSETYEKSLEHAKQERMTSREAEHASFLKIDFSPKGGWWQDQGKKKQ